MKQPNLKNYTTNVPEEKSILEIEQILAAFGATAILKDYSGDGGVKSISFKVLTEHGEMPFKIPMNERKIATYRASTYSRYYDKERVQKDLKTARMIGWRILKDWIHSQLSIVQLQLVKVEEVFLPYMYNAKEEKTFYEILEEKKFAGLMLSDQTEE